MRDSALWDGMIAGESGAGRVVSSQPETGRSSHVKRHRKAGNVPSADLVSSGGPGTEWTLRWRESLRRAPTAIFHPLRTPTKNTTVWNRRGGWRKPKRSNRQSEFGSVS